MSIASSNSATSLDSGRTLWLNTFYCNIPFNILHTSSELPFSVTSITTDIYFVFQFKRLTPMILQLTCTRRQKEDSTPVGNYKIEFCLYSNFFDYPKFFEMQNFESYTNKYLLVHPSYSQDLPSTVLVKRFEFKIVIKMIGYDRVSTQELVNEMALFFRGNADIFGNRKKLNNLCYIFKVPRLQDIFIGPHNYMGTIQISLYIQRTAVLSNAISYYLLYKEYCITPPKKVHLPVVLNYLYDGIWFPISDKNLVNIYIKGHRLGLDFLIKLSQDCILNRLKKLATRDLSQYEDYMFKVLEAAALVADEDLFDDAVLHLNNCEDFFNSSNLWNRFETSSIDSRFVIKYFEQRLRDLGLNSSRIEIGEASTSNVF